MLDNSQMLFFPKDIIRVDGYHAPVGHIARYGKPNHNGRCSSFDPSINREGNYGVFIPDDDIKAQELEKLQKNPLYQPTIKRLALSIDTGEYIPITVPNPDYREIIDITSRLIATKGYVKVLNHQIKYVPDDWRMVADECDEYTIFSIV